MKPRKRYILPSLILMLFAMAVDAATVRLDVSAGRGRREIGVGELFYITYEVSNTEKAPEKPASVPGGKVMYFDRTGQSSSFTSVNGKTTQSYSYTYTLTVRAQDEGTFTFGPVTVDGVKSNTVSYTIGAAQTQNVPGGGQQQQQSDPNRHNSEDGPKFIGKGDGNLYLRANVTKTTAYEQEALVYTVKLYTTYDAIKFIGATAAPKFEGFVVEESKDISNQLEYETINGKTYATAIIARYIIFPQMAGDLKVLGNTYTVSVDEREYYHDPFWGSMSVAKPLQLNVTPNDLTIKVKSLPSPVPANFSGGVGKFSITSTLPAQTYLTNQAASVVYTVSGTGNLKYVKLPDLNALYPAQLEVYSPTPDVQATVGKSNVSGTARFDYSFMPLEAGTFRIPDVQLVYFNPETGKYETSTARGYEISVGKGKGSEKSQTRGNMAFNPTLLPVGGGLSITHSPYVKRFGYWLFYLIPVILLLSAVGYYRAYLKANADLLAVRSRKADKMAKKRLRKAGACMKRGETDKFYDEMLSALWGYMGDKLKMPPSELSRQNISEKLQERDIPETVENGFIKLLDECEFAKYAPAATKDNMQPVYDEGVSVINSLEDAFKQQKQSKQQKQTGNESY